MNSGPPTEGLFVGGIQPGQEDIDWSGFSIDIVPESMSQTDNQVEQAHAIQLIELMPQLIQMKTTMPGANVDWLVDRLGESHNIKNLSQLVFNEQAMQQQMMMAQQQQAQQGQQPGQAPPGGGGPSPMSSLTANQGMGFPGRGAPAAPAPHSPVFPTNKNGVAQPLHKSTGPGTSPLPARGLPKTQSVGRA